MKQRPLQLAIPVPCHQNWDNMTSAEQGRFCSSCQKQVIDFTGYTDGQLYEFFSKPRTSVCGRMLATQVNRNIAIPHQPHSMLYRMAIAAGLVLLFAQPVTAQQKHKVPHKQHQKVTMTEPQIMGEMVAISSVTGTVKNDAGKPVEKALVLLTINGEEITHTYTDQQGRYTLTTYRSDSAIITVSAKGFKTRTIDNVVPNFQGQQMKDIRLISGKDEAAEPDHIIMGKIAPPPQKK